MSPSFEQMLSTAANMIVLDCVWAIEAQHVHPVLSALQSARARCSEQAIAVAEDPNSVLKIQGKTAFISLYGPMLKNAGYLEYFGFSSMRKVAMAVDRAAADAEIQDIVLVINSPGGAIDGLPELADAVAMAARKKPVIAQVDGMAASAAYWVASQASEIRMHVEDTVGSIGVFNMLFDTSKLYENEGVNAILLTTGNQKAVGAPGIPITEEQVAQYQSYVDHYFSIFKSSVESGRRLSATALAPLADGRRFVAQQAINNGLADKIMSLKQTVVEKSGGKNERGHSSTLNTKRYSNTSTARARLALLDLEY